MNKIKKVAIIVISIMFMQVCTMAAQSYEGDYEIERNMAGVNKDDGSVYWKDYNGPISETKGNINAIEFSASIPYKNIQSGEAVKFEFKNGALYEDGVKNIDELLDVKYVVKTYFAGLKKTGNDTPKLGFNIMYGPEVTVIKSKVEESKYEVINESFSTHEVSGNGTNVFEELIGDTKGADEYVVSYGVYEKSANGKLTFLVGYMPQYKVAGEGEYNPDSYDSNSKLNNLGDLSIEEKETETEEKFNYYEEYGRAGREMLVDTRNEKFGFDLDSGLTYAESINGKVEFLPGHIEVKECTITIPSMYLEDGEIIKIKYEGAAAYKDGKKDIKDGHFSNAKYILKTYCAALKNVNDKGTNPGFKVDFAGQEVKVIKDSDKDSKYEIINGKEYKHELLGAYKGSMGIVILNSRGSDNYFVGYGIYKENEDGTLELICEFNDIYDVYDRFAADANKEKNIENYKTEEKTEVNLNELSFQDLLSNVEDTGLTNEKLELVLAEWGDEYTTNFIYRTVAFFGDKELYYYNYRFNEKNTMLNNTGLIMTDLFGKEYAEKLPSDYRDPYLKLNLKELKTGLGYLSNSNEAIYPIEYYGYATSILDKVKDRAQLTEEEKEILEIAEIRGKRLNINTDKNYYNALVGQVIFEKVLEDLKSFRVKESLGDLKNTCLYKETTDAEKLNEAASNMENVDDLNKLEDDMSKWLDDKLEYLSANDENQEETKVNDKILSETKKYDTNKDLKLETKSSLIKDYAFEIPLGVKETYEELLANDYQKAAGFYKGIDQTEIALYMYDQNYERMQAEPFRNREAITVFYEFDENIGFIIDRETMEVEETNKVKAVFYGNEYENKYELLNVSPCK